MQSCLRFLAPLVLVCVLVVVFQGVHGFDFINFDDPDYVSENPFVIAGFTRASIAWAFSNTLTGHWHPITWLSHMLDCHLFGLQPGAHHLTNLVFHVCNSLLLYRFLATTTQARGASLVAALVFGAHPLRLESVAWISERKDVLSVFFGLLSVNAYARFSQTRSRAAYTLVCVMFILSLLAKPTFVTLPALFVLLDVFPLRRVSSGRPIRWWLLIREKIPLFLISGVFCVIALAGQFLGGGLQSTSAYPLPDRISSALVGYTIYLYRLFAPVGLGIFYPFQPYSLGLTSAAVVLLLALSVAAYTQLRARPHIFAGWFWFIVALLPMAGFIQIGGQSVANRWTYLPHIGLIMAVVWSVRDLLLSAPRACVLLSLTTVAVLAATTASNLPHWRSSISIFTHTLEVSPNNFMAHTNLGDAYLKLHDLNAAEPHLEAAVRLAPTYPEALNNLGVLYAHRERYAEAARLFTRALTQRPTFSTARYNLGLVQSRLGKNISALCEWITVLIERPNYEQARESATSLQVFAEQSPCPTILRSEGAYAKTAIERLRGLTSAWTPEQRDLALRSSLNGLIRCL